MAAAEPAGDLHVLRDPLREVGGEELLVGLRSALAWLQANQDQVNDLNVFPVPDGDTGSNMYLTLRAAVEDAQQADSRSASSVMQAAAHGSLMGARGNSGVILSQVLRGFAHGVGNGQRLTAPDITKGLAEATAVAYRAVMKPTEGTILTVVRAASDGAAGAARDSDDIRVVLERAVREAHAAVERTTDELAVLTEAGVVDAGGFGLAVILEGFSRALSDVTSASVPVTGPRRRAGEPRVRLPFVSSGGQPVPSAIPQAEQAPSAAALVAAREQGWGYCTEFLIHGPALDVESIRHEVTTSGDSAMVVGDADLMRIHVHTDDPAPLIATVARLGRLSKLKVEDMTAQHHAVIDRAGLDAPTLPVRKDVAIVTVAPGAGFRDILRGLGADVVVQGGQTMNPSTEDLLHASAAAHADEVILLPNNGNVILTAQQVNGVADGVDVSVVPTRNLPQGIAAVLAFDPSLDAETNRARMLSAAQRVSAIEVTRAVRDTTTNGHEIRAGDVIALVDDEITVVGKTESSVIESALRQRTPPPELVTVYAGGGVSAERTDKMVKRLAKQLPGVEFEIHDGGQEHYAYIISAE